MARTEVSGRGWYKYLPSEGPYPLLTSFWVNCEGMEAPLARLIIGEGTLLQSSSLSRWLLRLKALEDAWNCISFQQPNILPLSVVGWGKMVRTEVGGRGRCKSLPPEGPYPLLASFWVDWEGMEAPLARPVVTV